MPASARPAKRVCLEPGCDKSNEASLAAQADPSVAALVAWATANGAVVDPALHLVGRSFKARRSLAPGDRIAAIPDTLLFSRANLISRYACSDATRHIECASTSPHPATSDLGHPVPFLLEALSQDGPLHGSHISNTMSNHIFLYTSLLYEMHEKRDSFWRPYFDALPKDIRTPLVWPSKVAEQELRGTNALVYVTKKRKQLKKEYEIAQPLVAPFFSNSHAFTFDNYLYAHCVFSSRAFPVSLSSPSEKSSTVRETLPAACSAPRIPDPRLEVSDVALWPLLDQFDHSREARITWNMSKSTNKRPEDADGKAAQHIVSFISNMNIAEGTEVFNSYGPKSNAEWLLGYGFVDNDNPADIIFLRVNFGRDPLRERKAKVLSAVGVCVDSEDNELTIDWPVRLGSSTHQVFGGLLPNDIQCAGFSLLTVLQVLCTQPQELSACETALESIFQEPSIDCDSQTANSNCLGHGIDINAIDVTPSRALACAEALWNVLQSSPSSSLLAADNLFGMLLQKRDQHQAVLEDATGEAGTCDLEAHDLAVRYRKGQVSVISNAMRILTTSMRQREGVDGKNNFSVFLTFDDVMADEEFTDVVLSSMQGDDVDAPLEVDDERVLVVLYILYCLSSNHVDNVSSGNLSLAAVVRQRNAKDSHLASGSHKYNCDEEKNIVAKACSLVSQYCGSDSKVISFDQQVVEAAALFIHRRACVVGEEFAACLCDPCVNDESDLNDACNITKARYDADDGSEIDDGVWGVYLL